MGVFWFPFPERFFWLLLLPCFAFFLTLHLWNKERFIHKHPFSLHEPSRFTKRLFSLLLLFFSLFFLLFASLEPMGKKTEIKESKEGLFLTTITFILDHSASMRAKDVEKGATRYQAAIDWIKQYISEDRESSFTSLYLLDGALDKWVHKGIDKSLVSLYLNLLSEKEPQGGSDFSPLIYALNQTSSLEDRQIVYLLSDGEETAGKGFFENPTLIKRVEELKEKQVYLIPIAVGSKEGATIFVEGKEVRTFLQEGNLEKLATFPEERFSVEMPSSYVAQQVYAHLPDEKEKKGNVFTYFSRPFYLMPLFLGIFLLFVFLYFPGIGTLYPLLLLPFLATPGICEQNREDLAVEMLRAGQYQKANALLKELLLHQEGADVAAITYYNLAQRASFEKDYALSFFWLSYIDTTLLPDWFRYAVWYNQLLSLLLEKEITIHDKIRAQVLVEKLTSLYSSLSLFKQEEYREQKERLEKMLKSVLVEERISSDEIEKKIASFSQGKEEGFEEALKQVIEEQQWRIDLIFLGKSVQPASLEGVLQKKEEQMALQFRKKCAYTPWAFVVPYLDKAQIALATYTFKTPAEHLAYLHYLQLALAGLQKQQETPCQREKSSLSLQIIQQMEQDDRKSKRDTHLEGMLPW
jgi:hypothetical protein